MAGELMAGSRRWTSSFDGTRLQSLPGGEARELPWKAEVRLLPGRLSKCLAYVIAASGHKIGEGLCNAVHGLPACIKPD